MTQRDFYQVLGVAQDASSSDIRAAFVRLSKRHHPDLAGRDVALSWRLQDLQQAYHCLADATTRAAHDNLLEAEKRRHFARQRGVQRRLYKYDRRHPRPVPRPYRRSRWWLLPIALVLVAILIQLFVGLSD
uniref:J domain-containing protein n=1 Tax=uncultured Sphingomonas sp. TaxID=158754 RepID=UPI0035CC93E2